MHYVGVDVSCDNLEVYKAQSAELLSFANTTEGIASLLCTLDEDSQLILEPTSTYHHALLCELITNNFSYTLINPASIAAYARALNLRAKTDKADAKLLAEFASAHNLEPSTPPDQAQQQLKTLRRHIEWLEKETQATRNRLEAAKRSPWTPAAVLRSLKRTIQQLEAEANDTQQAVNEHLEAQQELLDKIELLTSIPGVGRKTAIMVLSEMPAVEGCASAKDWVAFSGLNPQIRQSGKGSFSRLSRMGSHRLRAKLYLPAVTALRFNPLVRQTAQRLKSRGKSGKLVVVAAMNKLIRLCFGVLRTARPFDLSMHQQVLTS